MEPQAEDSHRCSSWACFSSFIRKTNHLQGLQGFQHLIRFGKILFPEVLITSWCYLNNTLISLNQCHVQHFNAKLSDFGLAKHGPDGEESHVTTRVMGTYGYAAPEYVSTGTSYLYQGLCFPQNVYHFILFLFRVLNGS